VQPSIETKKAPPRPAAPPMKKPTEESADPFGAAATRAPPSDFGASGASQGGGGFANFADFAKFN